MTVVYKSEIHLDSSGKASLRRMWLLLKVNETSVVCREKSH